VVLAAAVHEPLPVFAALRGFDLADEDGVVPRVVLRDGAALEPGERALDERPAHSLAHVDADPLRAKCCAIAPWSAASRLAVQPSARRIGSCDEESLPIEMPTSGGVKESETSEPTVNPKRSESSSVVTTATGAGKRRIVSRSSSPVIWPMIGR